MQEIQNAGVAIYAGTGSDEEGVSYHVQPAEEGALVCKEGLGLNLHGDGGRHAVLGLAALLEPGREPAPTLPLWPQSCTHEPRLLCGPPNTYVNSAFEL